MAVSPALSQCEHHSSARQCCVESNDSAKQCRVEWNLMHEPIKSEKQVKMDLLMFELKDDTISLKREEVAPVGNA